MSCNRYEILPEEVEKQWAHMSAVKAHNAFMAKAPLAFVDTYGCQQNEADSEKLRGMLREMGYAFTPLRE